VLVNDRSSPAVQRVDCSESAGWVADDLVLADYSAGVDWAAVDSVEAGCWAVPELLLVGSQMDWLADSQEDSPGGLRSGFPAGCQVAPCQVVPHQVAPQSAARLCPEALVLQQGAQRQLLSSW
jgi:hypothetical protein